MKLDGGIIVDAVGSWRTDRLLLTERDAAGLRAALADALVAATTGEARADDGLELVAAALRSALVVPPDRIPRDVVTMRSRLVLADVERGGRREVVLVYPEEARPHEGRVSALSRVGAALLGLSEGALVAWPLPSGEAAVLRVESVEYQPEAAGELHL